MGAKRALIVDDSKSARLFLARALEKNGILVDNAESAEAAIEYLNGNRPDVIFMDHLMPGMDGLQALQAIKNDPRTATIPIMMYTSQEGELYVGQARALGAVGVLPKQIRPADVSKVLYQLHLLPDRRSPEQPTFIPLNPRAEAAPAPAPGAALARPLTDSALREHFAELRRALVAGIDTQTDRITAELREAVLPDPQARRSTGRWAGIVACAALALACASSALWWRSVQRLDGIAQELTQLRAQPAAPPASAGAPAAATQPAGPAAQAAVTGAPTDARPLVIAVPYGAEALGGARLELIGKLLSQLARQKVTGVVDIRTFAARFCLVGTAAEGYALPADETPFARCDLVGNPAEEGQSGAPRTPLALANLSAGIRSSTRGALDLQVTAGEPGSVLQAYPPLTPELTAGEWNRVAGANNRVEIRLH